MLKLLFFMGKKLFDCSRMTQPHEQSVMKEKIHGNGEKVKQNKILSYIAIIHHLLDSRCWFWSRRGQCKTTTSSRFRLNSKREMCCYQNFHSTNSLSAFDWSCLLKLFLQKSHLFGLSSLFLKLRQLSVTTLTKHFWIFLMRPHAVAMCTSGLEDSQCTASLQQCQATLIWGGDIILPY